MTEAAVEKRHCADAWKSREGSRFDPERIERAEEKEIEYLKCPRDAHRAEEQHHIVTKSTHKMLTAMIGGKQRRGRIQ